MKSRVLVHDAVVRKLDAAKTVCAAKPEQGGILLGAYRGTDGIELLSLTEAAPGDEKALTRFVRQDPRHQEEATAAWKASGGQITMVGEWHTHPSSEPIPSPTDLGTWISVVLRSRLPAVFAIAAPKQWKAYLGTRRFTTVRIEELEVIEEGSVGLVLAPVKERVPSRLQNRQLHKLTGKMPLPR